MSNHISAKYNEVKKPLTSSETSVENPELHFLAKALFNFEE